MARTARPVSSVPGTLPMWRTHSCVPYRHSCRYFRINRGRPASRGVSTRHAESVRHINTCGRTVAVTFDLWPWLLALGDRTESRGGRYAETALAVLSRLISCKNASRCSPLANALLGIKNALPPILQMRMKSPPSSTRLTDFHGISPFSLPICVKIPASETESVLSDVFPRTNNQNGMNKKSPIAHASA